MRRFDPRDSLPIAGPKELGCPGGRPRPRRGAGSSDRSEVDRKRRPDECGARIGPWDRTDCRSVRLLKTLDVPQVCTTTPISVGCDLSAISRFCVRQSTLSVAPRLLFRSDQACDPGGILVESDGSGFVALGFLQARLDGAGAAGAADRVVARPAADLSRAASPRAFASLVSRPARSDTNLVTWSRYRASTSADPWRWGRQFRAYGEDDPADPGSRSGGRPCRPTSFRT